MQEIGEKEIKKIELDMLNYINDLCKKNNIKYFLAYGTLLGAVKYNGFIPWDDDIDIYMLRDDYSKFIKILNESNSNYRCLTCDNTKDYYYIFGKVVDTRTKLIENAKEIKELGVYIDVFPLDYCKENYEKEFDDLHFINNMAVGRYRIKNDKFNEFSFLNNNNKPNKKVRIKKIITYLIDIITIPLGYNFYAKLFNKKCILKENERGNYLGVKCNNLPYKDVLEKEVLDNQIEIKFENNMFPVFKDYNKYLIKRYGDYTKDPPLSEQQTHHKNKVYYR